MKGKKVIKLLSFIIILAIVVTVGIFTYFATDKEWINLSLTNKYNDYQQKFEQLSTTASSQVALQNDIAADDEGMGEVENPLPRKEVTITAREGARAISYNSTYPIIPGHYVTFRVEVKNVSAVNAIQGLQIQAYAGDEQYDLYKKLYDLQDERGENISINPLDSYAIEFTVNISNSKVQIYVSGDNTEYYESQIYNFKLLENNLSNLVNITNVDHNLQENPQGVVYEGDKLQGEFVIYNNSAISSSIIFSDRFDSEYIRRRYTSLTININLPTGITISNLKYQDSSGTYTSSRDGKITINRQSNNNIQIILYELVAQERGYITFDYVVNSGCRDYSIYATGSIASKWQFEDEDYEDSREHRYECTGLDAYGWHTQTNYWTGSSEVNNYIVGHPIITIVQNPPYMLETEETENATEGELFVYEFEISNTGNAPAVNVKLVQNVDSDIAIMEVICQNQDSGVNIGKYTDNGQVNISIGKLNNNSTITIKIIARSRILAEGEQDLTLINDATIEAKAVSPITSNSQQITIVRGAEIVQDQTAEEEERRRLNESYAICNAIGEVSLNLRVQTGSGSDVYYFHTTNEDEHYCVQPGNQARTRLYNGQLITRQTVENWVNSDPTSTSGCGCASDVAHYLVKSATHWQCVKQHYTESSSNYVSKSTGQQYANLYDIGFIVSWESKWTQAYDKGWSAEKGQAIWQSYFNEFTYNTHDTYKEEGKRLLNIATRYKEFYEKIADTSNDQEIGMKPESMIDYQTKENEQGTRLEIYVDQTEELFKIGPFKLDYVDGSYTTEEYNYSFGGISDMYLLDENNNRVNITNIVKEDGIATGQANTYKVDYPEDGKGGKTFFSIYEPGTSNTDGNMMDWYDDQKHYPKPGEEFYIEVSTKYDYNQDGVIDSNDTIPAALKLKVEFQYVHTTASLCIRNGKYYYEDQIVSHGSHYHPPASEEDSGYSDHGNCTKTPVFSEANSDQDSAFILTKNREIVEQDLIIPIGDNEYITTTMKLGGFVFLDILEGKDNIANDIKTSADVNLANIEVSLYDAETNELAKLKTLAQERPNVLDENGNIIKQGATKDEIENKDDYTRRTNPTLTDESGYYEFRGLDIGKKYYVKFTYNGQDYIPTEYMQNSDITRLSATGSNYGATQSWQQSSKGTEKDGNNEKNTIGDEINREDFNNRFSSIGSSPNNYPSSNNLELNFLPTATIEGKVYDMNETFTEYELAGITLNSDGEYEVNTNYQLIDSYFTIENGYVLDHSSETGAIAKQELITTTIRNYIDNKDINGNIITGQYANTEHQYPTDDVMKNYIYQQIVNKIATNQEEIEEYWKKLQFIEDCQISSFTKERIVEENKEQGENSYSYDTYPYNNYFSLFIEQGPMYPNNNYANGTYSDETGNVYGDLDIAINGKSDSEGNKGAQKYMNIYPGQLFINQGLLKRSTYDVALKKDVYKATLKVNGRTEIYGYNEREILSVIEDEEYPGMNGREVLEMLEREHGKDSDIYIEKQLEYENSFWDIQERIIKDNYDSYYGTNYTRELYESDYEYSGTNELEAYITYKITIRNQSQGILAQIDEVVDYYDDTYEFMEDMSWIMYDEDTTDTDRNPIRVKEQDFYDIMVSENKDVLSREVEEYYKPVDAHQDSIYSSNTEFINDFEAEHYNTIYIRGLNNHKMITGETAYIYLTFKINGQGNGLELETQTSRTSPGKQNIAEINGYSTFYEDNTVLPNDVKKDSNDVAGIIDSDSNPGNFTVEDLNNRSNNRYEQNFEDDADRARGLTVTVEQDLIRQISGTVWEDKREYNPNNTDAIVGNGVREDDEVTISGIRVELHEVINGITQKEITKIWNGTSWIDAATVTNENGYYYFEGYIPGDYVVRFIYGGDKNYTYNGQVYECNPYYNGQDYKSTSYQYDHIRGENINNQDIRTDVSGEDYSGYVEYTNHNSQNESGTYGYSINKSDEFGSNVSDAKDILDSSYDDITNSDRQNVNNYSSNSYDGVTYELANTLNQNTVPNQNTQMIAETGVIRMEFEYNRQSSEGDNNKDNNGYWTGREDKNPMNYEGANNTNKGYYLQNVDFGLEERPKAGLELNKQISNIKVILSNQNVLFDANEAANNLIWEPKVPYNINDMKEDTIIDNKGNRNGAENVYSDYAGYEQLNTNNDQENRKQDYDDFRTAVLEKVGDVVTRQNGILQITMDEELMHGATIEITYDVTVTNIGEEDYNETSFYYLGEVENPTNSIVKTSANVVIDYVPNNMQFRNNSNATQWGWKTITQEEITNNGYVNSDVSNVLSQYNTIITTEALGEELYPQTETPKGNTQDKVQLILTQSITPQNSEDDMSYDNIAEIVQISNTVGRRMAYSVQGNQNPTSLVPLEPDSSKAERVVILPPFGEQYLYIGLGIFIVAMIGIAAVVIRKVVLNKNRF